MKITWKKNLGLIVFLCILLAVLTVCFVGLAYFSAQDGAYASAALFLFFFCIICALTILLFRGLRRWEVLLNENDLVYTPFFGAPKTIPYSSIQKIYTGGSAYILYAPDGKKLLLFDDFRFENASQAVSFLKNKGIKSEM